jgi:type IX secretion system PorP/SprF family membrane protein
MFKHQIFIIILFICFTISKNINAQDIHFSQFLASPLTLSPGATGHFNGDYRIAANHRTQWRSVTIPYQTFGGSFDMRNSFNVQNLGSGIAIYNDKAGDSEFSTLMINLSSSYTFAITNDSLHFLTAGIQAGISQRTINYNRLYFDNQFNGIKYDPNLSNGESFARDGYVKMNLNSGIAWTFVPKQRTKIMIGLTVFNLTKPKQTFYTDPSIKLDRRLALFGSAQIPIAEKIDILPALQIMSQGKYKEYIAGSNVRYVLQNEFWKYRAIYGGAFLRARDAGYIIVGMEYNDLNVGISYDINTSGLKRASNGRGGLELSLIYIFRKFEQFKTRHKACPTYI